MSTGIELRQLRKRFGSGDAAAWAVDGVDMDIPKGAFVTLLGPSGCGKTTTLRIIAGFEAPTSGQVLRGGTDVTDQPVTDRDMRMVFQDFALFPNMTVADNVAFGLRTRRMRGRYDRAEIRRRVGEFLELVHLDGHADKKPHQLSGGQKQRVSLARALVTEPEVVLFDEPLGSLDANLRKVMQVELIRLHRELNKTFIYVTHDQDEAMAMSDAIAVMNDGRVQQFGTPREIYDRPTSRYVAEFIGHAHIVETEVLESKPESVTIRLVNGETVTLADATQAGKGAFRRQEVLDLIALARVLADGRDTLALGALLLASLEAFGSRLPSEARHLAADGALLIAPLATSLATWALAKG